MIKFGTREGGRGGRGGRAGQGRAGQGSPAGQGRAGVVNVLIITMPVNGNVTLLWCHLSLGGYESRWKIEFGFEYFTGNHERGHLEEGISISFACTVYMY